jgi:hypothetical protein
MNIKINTLLLVMLSACVPLTQSSSISESNPKILRFTDYAYEPQIKTVLLHPIGDSDANLLPAVTKLGEWSLVLEFDDLRNQVDNYNARIVHCNHDWTKSDMMDLDFMREYNDFIINNYHYSIDTHVPYVHYTYNIPPVKLPGNYMVVVYRNGNKDDVILTKRFMVYDNRVTFERDGNLISSGTVAALNQQINFTISYKNIDIINPLESVHVVIRQNQRWDNLAVDIKPSFIRDSEHEMEYRYFDEKKMFRGGNEFRFFDLRSLNYPGRNVDHVKKNVKPFEAFIQMDKPRTGQAYAQYPDMDGNFIVQNLDYNDNNFTNYVYVNFTLMTPEVNGDVFVAGALNNWNLTEENKMRYDSAYRGYTSRMLLKQGWYDYQYLLRSSGKPPYYFEGSHFETQNAYEIFVYYKPFQPRADLLIGYVKLSANSR